MAEPLISLEMAKGHLQVVSDADDELIDEQRQQASDIVRAQMSTLGDDTWTDTNAPSGVQAAVFVLLTFLYERRGDDMSGFKDTMDAVHGLLTMAGYCDPALA